MHLTPDELIDLAEGTRAESAAPHLRTCDVCRRQLAELCAVLSAAADVEVPEPSPLFWQHFSQRVRDAVAAEGAPRRSWLGEWSSRRLWPISVAALAAVGAIVLYVSAPQSSTPIEPPPPPAIAEAAPFEPLAPPDDPSFTLVQDLTASLEWDAVSEAGITTHLGGSADEAVAGLSDAERQELQRLLKEVLESSGRAS
jgi:hypothetical protein